MLGRNGKLRIKAGLAAKQAASQQPHQQSGGNKGTEKAILHSGQADPLIFHMAMQVYRSHDFTQTGLTFHLSNFLLLDTPPSPLYTTISTFLFISRGTLVLCVQF